MLTQKHLFKLTNANKIVVALSGGLDSMVLLHSLVALNTHLQIRAIHIHHNLSKNADSWQEHCAQECTKLNISFNAYNITVTKKPQHSLEAIAREMRYAELAKHLAPDEVLATAHTQPDQAETVLLQLLRGAGPKGLAAMPAVKTFAHTQLIRPLLQYSRTELELYATENKLTWIDDESNLDLAFDRNYIRHKVLPQLQQRWPQTLHSLSLSARNCAESSELLHTLAAQDLLQLQTDDPSIIKLTPLLQLSPARQRNLLRHWIETLTMPIPDHRQLQQIQQNLLLAKHDASPCVQWQGHELRRFNDKIYCMQELTPHDPTIEINWDLQQSLELPNNIGTLTATKNLGMKSVIVRFRQGGEKLKLHDNARTQKLKHLMQQWQIPPWMRDRVPLIYDQDKLIAVVGLYNAEFSIRVGI